MQLFIVIQLSTQMYWRTNPNHSQSTESNTKHSCSRRQPLGLVQWSFYCHPTVNAKSLKEIQNSKH